MKALLCFSKFATIFFLFLIVGNMYGQTTNTIRNTNNSNNYHNNKATNHSRFEMGIQAVYFQDIDGDSFGNPLVTLTSNTQPIGYVLDNTDCNDNIAAINPGQSEVLYNGVDDNCDGNLDEDFQIKTNVLPSQCGTTLTSIGSLIGATTLSIPNITGYRFRATNGALVQTIDRIFPNFSLTMLASSNYDTTYTIEVELQISGVWLGYYGDACLISTPAILGNNGAAQISPSQCGITLSSMSTLLSTTSLAGVTGYRFRITRAGDFGLNAVQILNRTINWFSLTMLTQYNYGSEYTIEVAVKTTGAYSGYGNPCTVFSPPSPSLVICGLTISTAGTLVYCQSLNLVTQYRFEITRLSDNAVVTIDRNINWFNFNQVPSYSTGEQYGVRVAARTVNTWSNYGDSCEVTVPETFSSAPTGATGITTICSGESTTLTIAGGSSGIGALAQWFTNSCGSLIIGIGNSITVSPTSTQTYYVRYSGSFNTTPCAAVIVTVNTLSTTPTGATGVTTICSGESTTLSIAGGSAGTGAVAEWFTGSCGEISLGIGNTIIVSPTSTETYFVRYNGLCNTTSCGSVTVNVSTANTWTGGASTSVWTNPSNWSCGLVPTSTTDVTISTASFYPEITSAITINSLVIDSGTTVKVISTNSLKVKNIITNNGTLTIENNANLLQVDNVINTGSGSTIVKRNSSALLRLDYTLWSSPVIGQQLQSFSPGTLSNRFYTYNPTLGINGQYVEVASPSTTNFSIGQGYLIRMRNNHPTVIPTIWNGQFTGTPNNGNIPLTMSYGGAGFRFVAIGNPYPSPIDAVAFVNETTNAINTTGTLYFWRKTNNAASPSYCSWTEGGGFVSNGEAQVFDPNGVIQTGQGFFVEATGTGTALNFDNAMRIDNHNDQFFRPTVPTEKNRVWLNATNNTGAFSQMLVGYIEGATNGVDSRIDGRYINDGAIALNSLINNVKYAIQGKSLPFNVADVIPLSFSATNAGRYTIAIDHIDGIFNNPTINVYLKDNSNNVRHNLKQSSYTFNATAGVNDSRFEIVFQDFGCEPKSINSLVLARTSETLFDNNEFGVSASPSPFDTNFGFTINTTSKVDFSIKVYDMIGKLMEQRLVKANEVTKQILGNDYPSGVYNIIVSQGTEVKTLRVIKR